jgi:hypothetical protein
MGTSARGGIAARFGCAGEVDCGRDAGAITLAARGGFAGWRADLSGGSGFALEAAELLLADSLQQCLRLGELQQTPHLATREIEMARLRESGEVASAGIVITVVDFAGLEIEDLFIAELCYEKLLKKQEQARPGSQPTEV